MQVSVQYNLATLNTWREASMSPNENQPVAERLSFLELLQSTLWAAIGVQKRENRIRDFSHGNAWHFIYMGIGFTAFFVCSLIGIVKVVMPSG